MRIRDLTSQLTARIDPPPWRAPLRDVTEIAPGWRRHDRTHLEINLDLPADRRTRVWDAWIFLPQSFRLHPATYGESQICSDFHSQIRLTVPLLEPGDIVSATGELSEALSTGELTDPVSELKLFASRVRETIARDTFRIRMLDPGDDTCAEMVALIETVRSGLAFVRDDLLPVTKGLDPEIAQTARWVDEHLSRVFETALVKLVKDLDEWDPVPPVQQKITELAIREAQYRAAVGAGPRASANAGTRELEQVERRQHALKRLTSAVLWLPIEVRDARRGAEHALHAIAAGIAMAFALTAALLYGAPNDATDVWVWAGLVVLAYMGKDRIKAGLQASFSRYIDRRYPIRRCTIFDRRGERRLAESDEKVRYVEPDDIPGEIARFRSDVHRDVLGETTEAESVIHNRKSINVDTEVVQGIDTRYTAITEIFRIDMSRWLSNTDDARRSVTLADPMRGELFESSLPRAYDITIIYRIGPVGEEPPWSAARVVVSRKGIRRVDQLDA